MITQDPESNERQVYSLVAQRDNATNLQISKESTKVAEESRKIAELSRKDNLAMQEIAVSSAKDSATMRVIAAVTLFFLPATFVAVSKLHMTNPMVAD
jgi:hypothetical protein